VSHLAEPDGVAVRLGSLEEVDGLLDMVLVLQLSRQVVAARTVTRLVTDLTRLGENKGRKHLCICQIT